MTTDKRETHTIMLPGYAEGMIHEGEFEGQAVIRWGGAEGPLLGYAATWDGAVRVGGFVERIHALDLDGTDLLFLEVIGGIFPADTLALPTLDDMKAGRYSRPATLEPLGADFSYFFATTTESDIASLAQDALVSGLSVDVVGRLADDDQNLHELCGLPLVPVSLSLLR